MLVLDLERFHLVNDGFGSEAGDAHSTAPAGSTEPAGRATSSLK